MLRSQAGLLGLAPLLNQVTVYATDVNRTVALTDTIIVVTPNDPWILTLPVVGGPPELNRQLRIFNHGAATVTVKCAGADQIIVKPSGGVSSFDINQDGDFIILAEWPAGHAWLCFGSVQNGNP